LWLVENPTCNRCQNPNKIVLPVLCDYNYTIQNTIPLWDHHYGVHLLNPTDYFNVSNSEWIQLLQGTGTVMGCTIDYYLSWYKGSCMPTVFYRCKGNCMPTVFYFTKPTAGAHSLWVSVAIDYTGLQPKNCIGFFYCFL
jgi:hypothetical protein